MRCCDFEAAASPAFWVYSSRHGGLQATTFLAPLLSICIKVSIGLNVVVLEVEQTEKVGLVARTILILILFFFYCFPTRLHEA